MGSKPQSKLAGDAWVLGRCVLALNRHTGDVVVGTYLGSTSHANPKGEYFRLVKGSVFRLNKRKNKVHQIELQKASWFMMPYNSNTKKRVSSFRRIKRLQKQLAEKINGITSTIQTILNKGK